MAAITNGAAWRDKAILVLLSVNMAMLGFMWQTSSGSQLTMLDTIERIDREGSRGINARFGVHEQRLFSLERQVVLDAGALERKAILDAADLQRLEDKIDMLRAEILAAVRGR